MFDSLNCFECSLPDVGGGSLHDIVWGVRAEKTLLLLLLPPLSSYSAGEECRGRPAAEMSSL